MRQNDTRGSMPFAVIAVAILMASVAIGAVTYRYGVADESMDSITDDIDAVDEALLDITAYVNRGLGEIVMNLSKATDGDTRETDSPETRAESFHQKAADWIEFQFPIRSGGAVASLIDYDIRLGAEALSLSPDAFSGGYTPAYLKGTGRIHVTIESRSGSTDAMIDVSTDGNYALPLSAQRMSLFENMASSSGVSISQMMTYQLTSLAQYRVMNGYGGLSAYGEKGTSSIITPDDVRSAYRNALEAVRAICFRDSDRFPDADAIDLSDILIASNGVMSLDLSAVYSQALFAVLDEIALSWFDYFCGFETMDVLQDILNPFDDAIGALEAFLQGWENAYSATPYIAKVMEINGYSESEYRHPGSGTTTVSVGDVTVTVENPTADLMSAVWLKDFTKRYEKDNDFVKDSIMDILKGAAVRISENKNLGTVSMNVNPCDDKTFTMTLMELFISAVSDGAEIIEDSIGESLSSAQVNDPFYGAIADEIGAHASDFILEDQLRASILSAFSAAIDPDSEITLEDLVSSRQLDRAVQSYKADVMHDLGKFDALRNVRDEGSLVKRVLTEIFAFGLDLIGIMDHVPGMAKDMCNEIISLDEMNPLGGIITLPGTSEFRIDDGSGNITVERIDSEMSGTAIVGDISPVTEKCTHTVGFREDVSAAYSTVFSVTVSDVIDITLTGSGALSQAMGTSSSVLRKTVTNSMELEITVASGWALSGIDYSRSNTIWSDIWGLVKDLLEPLIEPLRKMMSTVRNVLTAVSEALIEALSYVAEQLAKIYEAILDPLGELKEWIEGTAEKMFQDAAFDILVSIALDKQSVSFEFFGCLVTFTTKAVTWAANTKNLLTASLTMPVAGMTVTAGIVTKVRGEMKADNLVITGFGGIEGNDWNVEMTLDPLMKGGKYLITVDGEIGDTDISMVAPKLDNYYEMGIALSDVPGLGDAISNIPVLGAKVALDAGFSLKYSTPIESGLIINEFETNPAGTDTGNEWVELLNNTAGTIDLTGYTMLAASDRRTKSMALSGSIAPGEFLVVHPTFTLVNSSGKYTSNGEAVVLKDPDGNEIQRTPTKKDGDNDGKTWQRSYDGSTEWVFADGSQGRSNNEWPGSAVVSAQDMKDTVWKAVERSFDKVPEITDLDTLGSFMKYMVRYTLEGLISIVSGQLIEASVYASVDLQDATSSASSGVRIALRTDGDLVEDVMKYVVGKIVEVILNAKNPYRIDPVEMFTENIDLEVTAHAGIGFPEILSNGTDLPRMDLGVTFRTNLSAITRIIGTDTGRPEMVMGIRIIDCPDAAIPSKLSPKKDMDHDLWLLQMTVRFA